MDETFFQYCQKLFVVDETKAAVLVARRAGEADYDGVYSLIGGKMEHQDESIVASLAREKSEEIGNLAIVDVLVNYSFNALFRKKDGSFMILPHYYARYRGGDIQLNEEYSDFKWVALKDLSKFQPLIDNVPTIGDTLLRLTAVARDEDFVRLPSME